MQKITAQEPIGIGETVNRREKTATTSRRPAKRAAPYFRYRYKQSHFKRHPHVFQPAHTAGMNLSKLLQQRQNTLRCLVCLCEHGLSGLCKNIVLAVLNHLLSHVCITDTGLCCGRVLNDIVEVVDGVL